MGDIFERRDGDCITLTISNAGKLNALTVEMWKRLKLAFDGYATDDQLRCVIITGAGEKAFCSGAESRSSNGAARPISRSSTFMRISSCPV